MMRLSDLSDVKSGRIPALVKGVVPDVERALSIETGDLIVAARGVSTDVLLASEPIFGSHISLDLYLVRPDCTKVDPNYLFAFLTLPATQAAWAWQKQGSSLARLPKEALEKTAVPLPPLQVQRLIAGLASSYAEESRLLKELSELNLVLGREVVTRAFSVAAIDHSKRRTKTNGPAER